MIDSSSKKPAFSSIIDEINNAQNGTRRRQQIIEGIEKLRGSRVLTYISVFNHPMAHINKDDIMPIEDALRNIGNCKKIDLIIHSPGGDPNSAEKIIKLCRSYAEEFTVIVPNSAKSAATLIALGSDEIVMGHVSELGPIDPQITYRLPNNQIVTHPAQSIIDSFEKIKSELNSLGRIIPAYIPILNNTDIALIDDCKKATQRSKDLAKNWLSNHMLKEEPEKAKTIAEILSDANTHLSHSRIIDRDEASNMGLRINKIDKDDKVWLLIWELYCRSEFFLRNSKQIKLFETSKSSIAVNS